MKKICTDCNKNQNLSEYSTKVDKEMGRHIIAQPANLAHVKNLPNGLWKRRRMLGPR